MLRTLHHVGIAVPDIETGRAFFTALGMDAWSREDGLAFRCPGRLQDQVRLFEGPRKALRYISFGTSHPELLHLARRLQASGFVVQEPPFGDREGLWFRDPDGDWINVRAAAEAPQLRPSVLINNPGDFKRLARRGAPHRDIDARPRRLGHVLKFTTNLQQSIDFYTQVLGMKLSDRIDGMAAFLRFAGDSDHHVLALAHSEARGLHHLSFEMGNLDEIQLCAERMIRAGYEDGWGVGRHIYGSNYFHYIRDPWRGLVELFWDIDFIPAGSPWESEDAAAGPEALYQWATVPPPADFLRNYEACS